MLIMSEKFLKLPRAVQTLILVFLWVITVACFVGCLIVKENTKLDLYWAEILLTCLGLFFSVSSVCLTILYFTFKKDEH